jgi:hypothetical protein
MTQTNKRAVAVAVDSDDNGSTAHPWKLDQTQLILRSHKSREPVIAVSTPLKSRSCMAASHHTVLYSFDPKKGGNILPFLAKINRDVDNDGAQFACGELRADQVFLPVA